MPSSSTMPEIPPTAQAGRRTGNGATPLGPAAFLGCFVE